MSAQCTTTGPFSTLSLKSSRLSPSGHSFFLGFHPIVFKEKRSCTSSSSQVAPQCAESRGAGERGGCVGGGRVGSWQCITHWWSESVKISVVGPQCRMGGLGEGRAPDPDKNKHYNQNSLNHSPFLFHLLPLLLSRFTFYSPRTLSNQLDMRHPCPQTQFLLGTYYPKHLLQCCVKVMCWLPYQELS